MPITTENATVAPVDAQNLDFRAALLNETPAADQSQTEQQSTESATQQQSGTVEQTEEQPIVDREKPLDDKEWPELGADENIQQTGSDIKAATSAKFEEGKQKASDVKDAALDKGTELKDAANEKIEQGKQKASDLKDAASDKASDIQDTVQQKASDFKEAAQQKASDLKEAASEKASELQDTLQQKTSDLKQAASDKASDLKDTVQQKTADMKEAANEKLDEVKEQASDVQDAAGEKIADGKEQAKGMAAAALEKAAELKDAALEKGAQLKDVALEKGAQLKETAMAYKDAALEKGAGLKDTLLHKADAKEPAERRGTDIQEPTADLRGSEAVGESNKSLATAALDHIKGAASGIKETVTQTATNVTHFAEAKFEQVTTEEQREKLHSVVEKVNETLHNVKEAVLGHKDSDDITEEGEGANKDSTNSEFASTNDITQQSTDDAPASPSSFPIHSQQAQIAASKPTAQTVQQ